MTPCRFIAFAVVAADLPASSRGTLPALSHLAAISVLIAERNGGSWRFALHSRAIRAGDGEDVLLAWATDVLPADGILLGWRLAERVVPLLTDAAASGDPEIGHAFLDRLLGLVAAVSVDLAIPHGGTGAPAIEMLAAEQRIAIPVMTPGEVESAWALGQRARLAERVEAEALAIWRLWLAGANGTAATAADAFADWARG